MKQVLNKFLRTGNVLGIGVAVAMANAILDVCRAIAETTLRSIGPQAVWVSLLTLIFITSCAAVLVFALTNAPPDGGPHDT